MKRSQDLALEKAIKKLGKDIKLIFLVLFNLHKETGITAIRDLKRYSKSNLLNDALSYFSSKFPSTNAAEFDNLWQTFENLFEKEADYDILLGFQSLEIREKIILKYKQDIINEIERSISTLNIIEKQAILLFLNVKSRLMFSYQNEIHSSIVLFNELYNLSYIEPIGFSDNTTIYDLAIQVGLLFKSTWKTTNKGITDHGIAYKLPYYLNKNLIEEITQKFLSDVQAPLLPSSELKKFFDAKDQIEREKIRNQIIAKTDNRSRGDFIEFD